MISRIDLRGRELSPRTLPGVVPRARVDVSEAMAVVVPIIDAVRTGGQAAVLDLCERLDGVRPAQLQVPAAVLDVALNQLDPTVREALTESIRRARLVHAAQLPEPHCTEVVPGGTVRQRWIPVERVGLYVPGGLAVYPSSVVMNVVPAQIAGVASLAVVSPPQRDNTGPFAGYPHPSILAACALLGVEEVYAVGGAQAVAMLAYGVAATDGPGCRPVDVITGPGNVYVASAKRALRGVVGIDAEAGPTEIAILADDGADPEHIAADLVSQAEHDPLAAAVLVTPSPALAERVEAALARRVRATTHLERVTAALTGRQSAIVLVDDVAAGLVVVNAYGAEHLEIHTADASQLADGVRNAGAVFVGTATPVSLGDYAAGSNHVLPTGGTSRHASGLSVLSFLRGVQVVEYNQDALADVAERVVALARAEDLPGHADAILARTGGAAGSAR
ncbi:MAG TPA: histidinol dehydrogenase [Dermatophilaceae bacterium]|nr:histidinol dehydrogenase [Dermatophilaceae bacterium]